MHPIRPPTLPIRTAHQGRSSSIQAKFVMEYLKKHLLIENQIKKLAERGLKISDKDFAKSSLSNISYYRLRAYTYPFQNNDDVDANHEFIRKDINFNDIIDLYNFDSQLRTLIFNALGKIEISIRTKIVNEYSIETGDSHWFLNDNLFTDRDKFQFVLDSIEEETRRSSEDFIVHYHSKYNEPDLAPSWMTLEVLSFGTLSKLFSSMKLNTDVNKRIADSFGVVKPIILTNWFHSFSNLRNYCAHHSRIWNRRFQVDISLPYNTHNTFIDRETIKTIRTNIIFASLCVIKYVMDIINPGNNFKKNLIEILENSGKLVREKDMGFPDRWRLLGVWVDK